jgi:hypothetical protein
MYSTCLFCNEQLEHNEVIEAFPVGKRLAFDSAKGRLWVVCRKCERWNLSPLDERWEAIEQAERLYRDTRKRVATDNIGLAKAGDGTTLIRIGEPMRPEFAAWRYGDQFGRRRQRQMLVAAGGVAAIGAVIIGGAVAGVSIGSIGWGFSQLGRQIVHGNPRTVVAKVRADDGIVMSVRRRHLAQTLLARSGDTTSLDLKYEGGIRHFEGPEAERIAAIIVPKVNRFGGNKEQVARAVEQIETYGTAQKYVEQLTKSTHVYDRLPDDKRSRRKLRHDFTKFGLFALPVPERLALEMALHEESERRALHGELEQLERAWRDAEEIAGISDNLLVPESVNAELDRLKLRKE